MEDEFLFAKGEFDVDKFLVLVDFNNRTFAEFLFAVAISSVSIRNGLQWQK